MDIVPTGPLPVASLLWQPKPGAFRLTIVCKATYRLVPGVCELADDQEAPNEEDNYWENDTDRSLYAPVDLVPIKPRADVLLIGHAFAPGRKEVTSLVTRLVVGSIDKSIEVFCDRFWTSEGALRFGKPFESAPIRYERAAAGHANPVGLRSNGPLHDGGLLRIPNLQPPGTRLSSRMSQINPIGYGPIAPSWPSRRKHLPSYASDWSSPQAWRAAPLPANIDLGYFNSAPIDQQVDAIAPDERIYLENLHPAKERFVTRLPGLRPEATVERGGGSAERLAMWIDTLWIHSRHSLCTATWRGQVELAHPDEAGQVIIAMATPPEEPAYSRMTGAEKLPLVTSASNPLISGSDDLSGATAFLPPHLSPLLQGSSDLDAGPAPGAGLQYNSNLIHDATGDPHEYRRAALPFRASPHGGAHGGSAISSSSAAPAPPQPAPNAGATMGPGLLFGQVGLALPFLSSPPVLAAPAAARADAPFGVGPLERERKEDAPPPFPVYVPPPALLTPSPGNGARDVIEGVAKISSGGRAKIQSNDTASPAKKPAPSRPVVASLAERREAKRREDAPMTAADVSNRAADPSPLAPASSSAQGPATLEPLRPRPNAVVELIGYDQGSTPAVRREPRWKDLLANLKPKPRDPDYDESSPPGAARDEAKDRRELTGVMTLVTPDSAADLSATLTSATDEDGAFVPPIVLLGGEIELSFDPLEALRATVAAMAPFIAGDKRLKEHIDTIEELFKTSWLQAGSGGVERLSTQTREIFAQGSRSLPPQYLDEHVTRMLLEQRRYQRRTMFGKSVIRALLHPPGGGQPMPAYLSEELARNLPMYQRFPARVVAELRLRLDQYERNPHSLVVIVLGRVLSERGSL